MDEQDWYEKDLSDFDEPQLSDEEYEGNFERFQFHSNNASLFNLVQEQIIQSKQKQRTKSILYVDDSCDGREYPLDLWYIIAMYIPPEDIGKFSLICRASNRVVNTVYFWMRLFQKYESFEHSLNEFVFFYC